LRIFREAFRERGYIEGENVLIKYAWAEGHNDRLPSLAADLISHNVNVIVAPVSTPAPLAAKKLTATIPIVFFTAGDPVALGLVQTLNRPGGNATGTTSLAGELAPKRVELLHELMPATKGMGLLVNSTNPSLMTSTTKAAQDAASTLGFELNVVPVGAAADFQGAFTRLIELRTLAAVIAADSFFTARREQQGRLALQTGIAAIYQFRDFAEAGGVMSYGGSLTDAMRIVGLYTARILNGEQPAELPVQQTTKAELVVNLKSAKSLGINVPLSLVARADEVIE
jgi:putative ABC transport system substrate-binding protein